MKRTVIVIVFGAIAFGAIVLARLPASWVLPTASADFSCSSVAGSLWNGYCSGLSVRGAALGDLTWQVRPARLLRGELAAHIDLERPPAISSRGDVEIGLGGTLVVHDLTASLPLSSKVIAALPPALTGFARLRLFGVISPLLLVMLAVALLLFYLYRFTALGREMLASGANPVAAKLSGLPVERRFVQCHALCGAIGAVAGMLASLRNGAIVPSMAGPLGADWLLPAFLAPVLGGTLLTGGEVSVLGAVLGAVFVEVISSGLYMMQIGEFWIQAALGIVLLAAILLERMRAGAALSRSTRR